MGNDIYKYSAGDFNFYYYGDSYSYLIPHTARAFTNAMNAHKILFNYEPTDKVSVFVNDLSDFGNGGAVGLPFNFVMLGINPFDNIYENMPANERIQWLASHELTHIVMCDKPAGSERFFRNVFFGKPINDNSNPLTFIYSYLASARWYSPRWFHEGIAIFAETFMNGGNGRMLGGYDEMVFRSMVYDSSYFYKPVGLETEGTTKDFMVGANAYLYGTRFVSYLASKYKVEKLLDFYTRSDSSHRFFATQFEKVFENDISTVWNNWIDYEHKFQQNNFNLINKYPVTKHLPVTDLILGSASRQFYDKKNNSLITAINYPGKLAHIAEINLETGVLREIAPVMSPRLYFVTNIAYDEDGRVIIITENNNNYRDLCFIDADSGEEIKKNEFERLGEQVFNNSDKSVWGIRNYNGRSVISRLLKPYNEVEEIYTIPFGYNFFDIDISSDGKMLSGTYGDLNGRQKIVIFKIDDLLTGKFNYEEIYEFENNSASNFTFSIDDKYLFGTSYVTGVSNIFRINIANKNAEIITNAELGYFRPLQINDSMLTAFSYSTKGLTPVLIKIDTCSAEAINLLGMETLKNNPVLKSWNLPPISDIKLDSIGVIESKYSIFNESKLAYLVPVIEGYKDFPAFGFYAKIMDKIYLNSIDLNLSYSYNELIPENERIHFILKYNYWFWELTASWNRSDFYDLFGPTKRSREGGMISLRYHDLIYPNRAPEKFEYSFKGAYYFDLKTLPMYQNISVSANNLIFGHFSLNYNVFRKSLGAVENESGFEYKLNITDEYVFERNFIKIFASADFAIPSSFRNSSVWFRLNAGKSFGIDDNPFNYFYFGGFGNNYLDNNSVQRYRDMLSFPGVEINSTPANQFVKAMAEWNLPPVRFKHLGFLPAYFTYSRISLFSTVLAYEFDSNFKNSALINTGIQIDFEMAFFYLMKTYLSFGYAMAFRDNQRPSDEFMISLKF